MISYLLSRVPQSLSPTATLPTSLRGGGAEQQVLHPVLFLTNMILEACPLLFRLSGIQFCFHFQPAGSVLLMPYPGFERSRPRRIGGGGTGGCWWCQRPSSCQLEGPAPSPPCQYPGGGGGEGDEGAEDTGGQFAPVWGFVGSIHAKHPFPAGMHFSVGAAGALSG